MCNLTTGPEDLARFADRQDLESMLETYGLDGVELMDLGADVNHILPPGKVIGFHMSSFPDWMDLWNGNIRELNRKFDNEETWRKVYGIPETDSPLTRQEMRQALIDHYRYDLGKAHRYHARYVVFHVMNASFEETVRRCYRYRDEDVIDAAAELINEITRGEDGSLLFLVENLWESGFTFTDADMTRRLIDNIRYENRGIMLDTGHLFHTSLDIQNQVDGLAYIHRMLDLHGDLCRWIRGVHLHQSVTTNYIRKEMENPPVPAASYEERNLQMFTYAFAADRHEPFTCPGVGALIERIRPDYLTFEFITRNRAQLEEYLKEQREALDRDRKDRNMKDIRETGKTET